MPGINIETESRLSDEVLRFAHSQMVESLVAELGASGYETIALTLRDETDSVVGCLRGATFWGWLNLDVFWVKAEHRRHGHGSSLLKLAEAEARKRGCHAVYQETFSPGARSFAERNGYQIVYQLGASGSARTKYSLFKQLG